MFDMLQTNAKIKADNSPGKNRKITTSKVQGAIGMAKVVQGAPGGTAKIVQGAPRVSAKVKVNGVFTTHGVNGNKVNPKVEVKTKVEPAFGVSNNENVKPNTASLNEAVATSSSGAPKVLANDFDTWMAAMASQKGRS